MSLQYNNVIVCYIIVILKAVGLDFQGSLTHQGRVFARVWERPTGHLWRLRKAICSPDIAEWHWHMWGSAQRSPPCSLGLYGCAAHYKMTSVKSFKFPDWGWSWANDTSHEHAPSAHSCISLEVSIVNCFVYPIPQSWGPPKMRAHSSLLNATVLTDKAQRMLWLELQTVGARVGLRDNLV